MKAGKLSLDLLAKMLARLPGGDPRVMVGPGVGEDAAVIEFDGRLLAAKTDPVTFAHDLIGWYAVQVNANDIAVMGGEPLWFMATLLLPENFKCNDVKNIFDQIAEACRALGVTGIGGHTEITLGLEHPIVVGCMLGEVEKERLVTSAGAKPDDVIILSGEIAIEGTALLARDADEALLASGVPNEAIAQARELLFNPGISVVSAAQAAVSVGGITAMHDPTEGGLATGLLEVAFASGVGLEIDYEHIPVLSLTGAFCIALDLDPLGLIASGSLLITASSEKAVSVVSLLEASGIKATIIGKVTPKEAGCWLLSGSKRRELPQFERDELSRFFDEYSKR